MRRTDLVVACRSLPSWLRLPVTLAGKRGEAARVRALSGKIVRGNPRSWFAEDPPTREAEPGRTASSKAFDYRRGVRQRGAKEARPKLYVAPKAQVASLLRARGGRREDRGCENP